MARPLPSGTSRLKCSAVQGSRRKGRWSRWLDVAGARELARVGIGTISCSCEPARITLYTVSKRLNTSVRAQDHLPAFNPAPPPFQALAFDKSHLSLRILGGSKMSPASLAAREPLYSNSQTPVSVSAPSGPRSASSLAFVSSSSLRYSTLSRSRAVSSQPNRLWIRTRLNLPKPPPRTVKETRFAVTSNPLRGGSVE